MLRNMGWIGCSSGDVLSEVGLIYLNLVEKANGENRTRRNHLYPLIRHSVLEQRDHAGLFPST